MPHNQTSQNNRIRLADFAQHDGEAIDNAEEFFCDDCPPTVPIVGKSPAMTAVLKTLRMVAESGCNPLLVVGATGTGKEGAARAMHAWRNPANAPFLAINCAALTSNLLESELFGHERGSFTGADREKTGLLEAADTGTIFLDEISEMDLDLQAKLLRVLQEMTFRRVGGTTTLPCRATIIASSNRDLLDEVEQGRFRRDLYYRLAVFPVEMPALADRERRSDIPLLARYFLQTAQIRKPEPPEGFSPAAEQLLLSHHWPGNVRELRNIVTRAIILNNEPTIQPEAIRIDRPVPGPEEKPGQDQAMDLSLETAEQKFIKRALEETGWQRTKAASLLGITRATLHSKLKRYGIKPPEDDTVEACA
jgi:two-component system NtrC family response regulator